MEDIWKHLPGDVFMRHIAPLCPIDVRLDLGVPPRRAPRTSAHLVLEGMLRERATFTPVANMVQRLSSRVFRRGALGNLEYESIGIRVYIYYDGGLNYSIEKWYEVCVNGQTFAAISSFDLYDCEGRLVHTVDNGLEGLPKPKSISELYRAFMNSLI